MKLGGSQPSISGADVNACLPCLLFAICATFRSKKKDRFLPDITGINVISLLVALHVHLMKGSIKLKLYKKKKNI